MSQTVILIVFFAIFAGAVLGALAVFVFGRKEKSDNLFLMLQNQLNESMREINTKFSDFLQVTQEFTKQTTKLEETNRQVVNFADQLNSLQDILRNPKQRGILGEYFLETILKNVLPPDIYKMQYKLGKDDTGKDLIPDAVVFVRDRIIPIDSKFSLENYNKVVTEKNQVEKERLEKVFVNDLKTRIVETSKYIQPAKGTTDFAFMFIPHEAIYYDLLINKVGAIKEETDNLIQRAASKFKVVIISPTTLLAYLQTVLQGLNELKIEESAKEIIKRVDELEGHLKNYGQFIIKLGSNLRTTVNAYDNVSKEFSKIDKDLLRITDKSIGFKLVAIDKPDVEE